MRCVPKQQRVRATRSILAALLIAGFLIYSIPPASGALGLRLPAWPFTALAFACLIAAVFLLVRYEMTGFQYIIRPRTETDDTGFVTAYASGHPVIYDMLPEQLDFAVVKSQGARPGVLECLFSLGDLIAVYPLRRNRRDGMTKADLRERYAADGYVWYDYTLTLGIDDALALVFVDGNRTVGILIEADEEMRGYLTALKPGEGKRKVANVRREPPSSVTSSPRSSAMNSSTLQGKVGFPRQGEASQHAAFSKSNTLSVENWC